MDYYLGLSVSRAVCTKAIRDFWSRGVIELTQTCRINKQIAKLNTLGGTLGGTLTDKKSPKIDFRHIFIFDFCFANFEKKISSGTGGGGTVQQ